MQNLIIDRETFHAAHKDPGLLCEHFDGIVGQKRYVEALELHNDSEELTGIFVGVYMDPHSEIHNTSCLYGAYCSFHENGQVTKKWVEGAHERLELVETYRCRSTDELRGLIADLITRHVSF